MTTEVALLVSAIATLPCAVPPEVPELKAAPTARVNKSEASVAFTVISASSTVVILVLDSSAQFFCPEILL